MNKTMVLVLLAALSIFAEPALVQAATSAEKNAPAEKVPNIAEFDKQVAKVNDSLQEMDALMDKIQKTQNPQERKQLLQQYWVAMQGAMGMMHGMWGPGGLGCCAGPGMGHGMMGGPGMGCCMGGGPMMGWQNMQQYYSNLTPEQQKQRQYMTDQYMRMQQSMMKHMMQHQYWMNQPQPPAK